MLNENEEEIKIEYYDENLSDPLHECDNESMLKTPIKYTECASELATGRTENVFIHRTSHNQFQKPNTISWYKETDNDGQYLCRYCDSKYSTVQTLRYHTQTKHPNESEQLKVITVKNKRNNKMKCHICNARFQDLKNLKNHFTFCHYNDSLSKSCIYCDATFDSVDKMKEHQHNLHNVIKNATYLCKTCGYRTLKKSHFNQHLNTHSMIKNMHCKYCDYKTNYLSNLKIHERIHTNIKPYKCDFTNCIYTCSAKSALRSHQLKHFPLANMLYCDQCSYKTVYKQSLAKHQDSHKRNSIGIKII